MLYWYWKGIRKHTYIVVSNNNRYKSYLFALLSIECKWITRNSQKWKCMHVESNIFSLLNCGINRVVINAIFNNISVISWRWVLMVEETIVPGENHRFVASHWQTLSHNVVSSRPGLSWIRTQNVSGNRHWLHR
jgi:hypothetical protein